MGEVMKVTQHKSLFGALAAAQKQMGPALKDATNQAFKSKYADLANVMDACLPALNSNGICVLQPICDEDGKRFVKTILAHESGEVTECRVELIVNKNDMQGYGSAITYARRYGLMSMAGVAPEDDDGNAAASAPMVEPRREAMRHEVQANINAARAEGISLAVQSLMEANSLDALAAVWRQLRKEEQANPTVLRAKEEAKEALSKPVATDLGGDSIPY